MKYKRVYIDIDEPTEIVIKTMLGKSCLTSRDYQKFFIGLTYNAANSKK
jgi:hypothetical protein